MSKFGVNVPPGIPATTLDEVKKAVDQMADEKGEVRIGLEGRGHAEHAPCAYTPACHPCTGGQ